MLMQPRRPRTASFPLVALAALALVSAACDIVTADLKSEATADWRKTFTLEPGGRLEIENVNGSIHVPPSDGNQVEIVAQKKAKAVSDDAAKEALGRIEIVDLDQRIIAVQHFVAFIAHQAPGRSQHRQRQLVIGRVCDASRA